MTQALREKIIELAVTHGVVATHGYGVVYADQLMAFAAALQPDAGEAVYIVGHGWQCDMMPPLNTPLYLRPQPAIRDEGEAVGEIVRDGEASEFKVSWSKPPGPNGTTLFTYPPDAQARIASLEAENERAQTELRVIRQSCPEHCAVEGSTAGTAQNYIASLEAENERLTSIAANRGMALDVRAGKIKAQDTELVALRNQNHADGMRILELVKQLAEVQAQRDASNREIERLRDELEVAQRDARRYQHLVATCNIDYAPEEPWQLVIWEPNTGEDWKAKLDEAIDSALSQSSQAGALSVEAGSC